MKSVEHDVTPRVLTDEDLLDLQLRIAQRADELADACESGDSLMTDVDCWRQAEREVLGDDFALLDRGV